MAKVLARFEVTTVGLRAASTAAASPTRTLCPQVSGRAVGFAASNFCTRRASRYASVVCSAEATEQPPPLSKRQQKKQQQQQQRGGGKGKVSEERITPKGEDYSRWYLDIVKRAELADYGPVRGTMVVRPYGFAIWEALQSFLDRRFKETGHSNCYFPQLIPYSFIEKEADHVEGFAPELALVTKGGGKDLEEPLVVRPTSETIVNHMFAQWVSSYRDLPLLTNQWCNVHRWEMRTRPFIRTLEFLWQEGHTAHVTAEEAEEETRRMLGIYQEFARDMAAIPVIPGQKSRVESFAGANCTYTIEAMMGDRRALQAGTSHNLGQNFSRAFGTQFQSEAGELEYVHQSSWGMSTRMIGGIIMTHGDDMGLRLPPKIAPVQVVIVPIVKKDADRMEVIDAVDKLETYLNGSGIRVKVDNSDGKSPGWKFNYWEMKGVPIRIEVGPKDVAANACVVARRDRPGKEGKQFGVSMEADSIVDFVDGLLDDIQESMLREATEFRDANIADVGSYEEMKAVIAEGKWARGGWSGSDEEEKRVKEETQATLRCFPFDQPPGPHTCFLTGQPAQRVALFAKAY
uniref:proline--tRNA ligase n=1 Tax=Tetraselmis chuii TaxID=63592 RepID=A0A7S1SIA5_9CHLO|mmetsp:Transcript_13836/g.24499  ORF Transcript_13836/g.24499 Transcript_13836/m.24499 type:complete len:573 (+) Transcript_13836:163-1881(+)|eukprot:CAMPEP_0177768024 /NCGR_PEP_ID=MMETSP0491_2-20121128/9482_1 /TAXON_ID=63592 /ORGANISM="Tetraselmis chuii, Strain PLY429" /LENGTH=572 /DNA_ID=CAMNT_0019284767 /DNA_START=105 /DNA_END=1823 /DNA_ORIENTATION=+